VERIICTTEPGSMKPDWFLEKVSAMTLPLFVEDKNKVLMSQHLGNRLT
jgi:hypothetical protein